MSGRRSSWSLFACGLLTLCVAWSLAGPRFSAPDEPAHFIKAASVVRGQLHGVSGEGRASGGEVSGRAVEVPGIFRSAEAFPACYAFRGDLPASCAPEEFVGGTSDERVATPAGSYPPLFYLIVGWPTLLWQDADVIYAMRLASAVANVALLVAGAWALARVIGRRRAMAVTMVAVTPMVAYLSATVNPNSLEIAAGFATWCFALAVRRRVGSGRSVDPALGIGLVVSGAVLANVRWLGPAILLGILLVVALAGPVRELLGAWRDRVLVFSAAAIAGAVAMAGLVIVTTPSTQLLPATPVPEGGAVTRLVALVGNTGGYVRNMIGHFGWLDTPTPTFTLLVWMALVSFLVGTVALVGSRPIVRATALTVVGTFVLPIAAQWPGLDEVGMVWQGRYTLPVAVGIVVLAGAGVFEAGRAGRIPLARVPMVLAVPAAAGHLVAFWWTLRRYVTGKHGSLDLLADGVWEPPGGVVVWVLVAAVGLVACVLPVLGGPPQDVASHPSAGDDQTFSRVPSPR